MASSPRKPVHAFWLFFPAAALWAALVVPLSIWAVVSGSGWPPGLLGAGHGHELIFGFALALVAGYTLGPQPWRVLGPLFTLWLGARLFWLLAPASLLAQVLSPAFALLMAWHVVPRFHAAKKWRNKIAGPLILALCLIAVVYGLAGGNLPGWQPPFPDTRLLMYTAIVGLLLLMTFMGGRIIAPAVAGTLEKRGIPLQARVQPRIEGSLLLLLPAAMVLLLSPISNWPSGTLLLASALLITLRIMRWKLWHCLERPDLLVLALGYLWLAAGAGTTGLHLIMATEPLPALHVITIGALGTLSTSIMLRLAWQRARRCFPPHWQILGIAIAMAVAAMARYQAGSTPFTQPALLWLSAACWSVVYLGVTWQLFALFQEDKQRRK